MSILLNSGQDADLFFWASGALRGWLWLSAEELVQAFLHDFFPVGVEIIEEFLDALEALLCILHHQVHGLFEQSGEFCLDGVFFLVSCRLLKFFAETPAFTVDVGNFPAVVIFSLGHFFPEFLEVFLAVFGTQFHQPLVFFRFIVPEIFEQGMDSPADIKGLSERRFGRWLAGRHLGGSCRNTFFPCVECVVQAQ